MDMPIKYFQDFGAWYNFAYPVIQTLLIWLADALVVCLLLSLHPYLFFEVTSPQIYRCWIVWRYNYYVIILPSLLLALSVVANSIVMFWLDNPDKMEFKVAHPFFTMIYPINLAQNILTTGLISYRIWRSRQQSRTAGLQVAFGMDMMTVVRIILESAMIYTIQLVIVLILYLADHPAQLILFGTMAPTVGTFR